MSLDNPPTNTPGVEAVPASLLRTWVEVPADAWKRLSEHRWHAPHRVDGFVTCVVVAFGQTIGRACLIGDESATYADLFTNAADLAAHRLACAEATPAVRPDNEANAGVVGRCWWCGKWPSEHGTPEPDIGPFRPGDTVRADREAP